MPVSERVGRLRQRSLEPRATLSIERAQLITEFYKQDMGPVSTPIRRALAFKYLMGHKTVYIGVDELIVGEKGHAPRAAPTYPEICCHSLEDLDMLESRANVSFQVSPGSREVQEQKIIPFWRGKTMRELIFQQMAPEWEAAYEAGVFTEFMEQRSPGHTALDGKIYRKGMVDFKGDIRQSLDDLDFLNDPEAYDKQEQLKAMDICADALIHFAQRHAKTAQGLALEERDPRRKAELERIAQICTHVPAHAPRDLWEALQYYWFVHVGVTTELNPWDAFSPGRLDQHLYPFYVHGLDEGTLTLPQAEELLQCLWIKFNNQPAPPKVGVTAAESNTYNDFAQINLGGLRGDGSHGVNEVTYLILDVVEEMRLLQPSPSVHVSKKSPDRFLKRAAEVIRTGFGQPSVFNSDVVVQEMLRVVKSIQDARDGGTSGCVETGAFGKENYNLSGYLNMPKVLEITLNNGVDPQTGLSVGLQTGDPAQFGSFEELFAAYNRQLNHFVEIKVRGNNIIESLYAKYLPVPFLSLLTDDCIARGRGYHDGGARYNTTYIQGVGIGTMADALTAIRWHAFDRQTLSMEELLAMLRDDFRGHERLLQMLLNKTPKYGNDDDYADDLMAVAFDAYFDAIDGRKNMRGGTYHVNLLPTTVHVHFGSVVGATPDGRRAGKPLSEGVSPVQGADRRGPTAVIKSVAKMDHVRTGGTLLNQKFSPQLLGDEESLDKFVKLIRTYFKLDGHHVQFNVVDARTLRAAQEHPDEHRDLIVRVAGYSDYFCDIGRALQDEIIARTEHQVF